MTWKLLASSFLFNMFWFKTLETGKSYKKRGIILVEYTVLIKFGNFFELMSHMNQNLFCGGSSVFYFKKQTSTSLWSLGDMTRRLLSSFLPFRSALTGRTNIHAALMLQNKNHCTPLPFPRLLLGACSIVHTSIGGLCPRQAPSLPLAGTDTACCPLYDMYNSIMVVNIYIVYMLEGGGAVSRIWEWELPETPGCNINHKI